jgi:hypothetical protein
MVEPIQRIRVFVLGKGDNPLTVPIDVRDPAILQAIQRLIEADAVTPRVTDSAVRIVRAVMRTGVANLQRVLSKKLMTVADDGRLEPIKADNPKAIAVGLVNKVR